MAVQMLACGTRTAPRAPRPPETPPGPNAFLVHPLGAVSVEGTAMAMAAFLQDSQPQGLCTRCARPPSPLGSLYLQVQAPAPPAGKAPQPCTGVTCNAVCRPRGVFTLEGTLQAICGLETRTPVSRGVLNWTRGWTVLLPPSPCPFTGGSARTGSLRDRRPASGPPGLCASPGGT